MEDFIVGYKVFNPDWTCRGFQYEVGGEYRCDEAALCESGFHFCTTPVDCFKYYSFSSENKVALVIAKGYSEAEEGCSKRTCNHLFIAKEIAWAEVLQLCNTGQGNSGNQNSGNRNSGDWNSGDRNSGHQNSGNQNSGNRNSGDQNSGHWNSGNRNSGHQNSGNQNSGNRNSGDQNSGHWNSGNRNSGHFNIDTPPTIRVFGQDIDKSLWENCYKPNFLYFDACVWVASGIMTDSEKEANPGYETLGGYLKTREYKEAFKQSWEQADHQDRMRIKDIPGFDEDMFYEISGIRVSDYE